MDVNVGQGTGPSQAPGFNVYNPWQTDATNQGLQNTSRVPAFILSQGAPDLPPLTINPRERNEQLLGPIGGRLQGDQKLSADPSVLLWNFQIQRELPGNFAIFAGYVGSHGTHLVGENNRTYSYVPTAVRLQLRSQLDTLVPMPPDLARTLRAKLLPVAVVQALSAVSGRTGHLQHGPLQHLQRPAAEIGKEILSWPQPHHVLHRSEHFRPCRPGRVVLQHVDGRT